MLRNINPLVHSFALLLLHRCCFCCPRVPPLEHRAAWSASQTGCWRSFGVAAIRQLVPMVELQSLLRLVPLTRSSHPGRPRRLRRRRRRALLRRPHRLRGRLHHRLPRPRRRRRRHALLRRLQGRLQSRLHLRPRRRDQEFEVRRARQRGSRRCATSTIRAYRPSPVR